MHANTVLVISPTADLHASLGTVARLSNAVTHARPGAAVLAELRRRSPAVVIVDRIDERPEAAQLEVALVKAMCPHARVIALSGNSSPADAVIIELGIFCYAAGPSESELLRLIEAAAAGPREEGGANR